MYFLLMVDIRSSVAIVLVLQSLDETCFVILFDLYFWIIYFLVL